MDTAGKVITCKAAVAWGPKEPLVIEEVQVHPPKEMEVRIKITHTSLCHTDLTFWMHGDKDTFPRIFGHEGAGIIESVGGEVTDLKAGDHVIPLYTGECGDCVYCKSHDTNLCEKFKVDLSRTGMISDEKTRFFIGGKPINHFLMTSTFSQYTVVDYACVTKINPNAPLDKVCLLGCGVATGIGSVCNVTDVGPESTVAIFGLGTIGLAAVQGAKLNGASRIIAVDINADKFEKSNNYDINITTKVLGATDCINPKNHEEPIDEVIRGMTKGGVDYSFECAGSIDVLHQAFASTNKTLGLTVLVGLDPSPRMKSLSPLDLLYGRRIVGAIFGRYKGKTQLPELVEKYMNNEINLEAFITHEKPLADINTAFDLLLAGESLRCVIHL